MSLVGSITAVCVLDETAMLATDGAEVEEIHLLKAKPVVVDLIEKGSSRFEDPNWKQHLQSLKPLGLACTLGSAARVTMPDSSGATVEESLARFLGLRATLPKLLLDTRAIGFRQSDAVKYLCRTFISVSVDHNALGASEDAAPVDSVAGYAPWTGGTAQDARLRWCAPS